MSTAKMLAAALCALVLAMQAYPIFSRLEYQNYYWPFVNYPMYSDAHRMGESVSSLKLEALSCHPGASPVPVTDVDLRIKSASFNQLLQEAAGLRERKSPGAAERASQQLRQLVATELSTPACTVELWRRTITIGRRGLEDADPAWHLAAEWTLAKADSTSQPTSTQPSEP